VGALPALSGYLSKCGSLHKNWQRRYFTLSNGVLSYFGTPNDAVARGSVRIDESAHVAADAGERHRKKHCFEIVAWQRVLPLIAENEAELELWKSYLEQTLDCVKARAAQQCIKRGLVMLRESGLFRGVRWRQKWAVLEGQTLSFYDSPEDPPKQISPTGAHAIVGQRVVVATSGGDRQYCFRVTQAGKKGEHVELSARSRTDMDEWVTMLRQNAAATDGFAAEPAWGEVQAERLVVQQPAGEALAFDAAGLASVQVVDMRTARVQGEQATLFLCEVSHRSGMRWRLARKYADFLALHAAFANTDPKKHTLLGKFLPPEPKGRADEAERRYQMVMLQAYMKEALQLCSTSEHGAISALLSPFHPGGPMRRQ
jgi:hypothetical protein